MSGGTLDDGTPREEDQAHGDEVDDEVFEKLPADEGEVDAACERT